MPFYESIALYVSGSLDPRIPGLWIRDINDGHAPVEGFIGK